MAANNEAARKRDKAAEEQKQKIIDSIRPAYEEAGKLFDKIFNKIADHLYLPTAEKQDKIEEYKEKLNKIIENTQSLYMDPEVLKAAYQTPGKKRPRPEGGGKTRRKRRV